MALTKCNECGTDISDKATACPKCGAPASKPKKKTGLLTWIFAAVIAFVAISALTANHNAASVSTQTAPAAKPGPTAQQKLEESDRMNAGALVLMLRKSAKDPDSFKLHSATVTKDGAGCVEYSATNSFNARLRAIAVVTRGKTAVSNSPATWNKLCAHKDSTDYTDLFIRTLLE